MASEVQHLRQQVQQLQLKLTEKEEELAEKNREILGLKQDRDRISHEKDIEIKDLEDRITLLEMEAVERNVEIVNLNDRIQNLEAKLGEMVDTHWVYIGQVALEFCENAYKFIMGDSYKEFYPYFMTDIESHIEDIENTTARSRAYGNYQTFKDKTGWKKTMASSVKEIRKERNIAAHFRNIVLDQGKAIEAIEELNRKKKLKGITSKHKVQKIVNMWEISRTGFK